MSDKEHFSLLWDANDTRETFRSFAFHQDLKVNDLLYLRDNTETDKGDCRLYSFYTKDQNTMQRRCTLFTELLSFPKENDDLLRQCFEMVCGLNQIAGRIETIGKSNEASLYATKEIEIYTDTMQLLHRFCNRNFHCAALQELKLYVNEVYDSTKFKQLCDKSRKIIDTIGETKSITIGVNLDAQFQPMEAGIVSVNSFRFVSGSVIDSFLRLGKSDGEERCLTPLQVVANKCIDKTQSVALNEAIQQGLVKILGQNLKNWTPSLRTYISNNAKWVLRLIDELQFIVSAIKVLRELQQCACPLCMPEFAENESILGLYHPLIALRGKDCVSNDLTFRGEGQIYILTGPNQGGKSIYLQAVGLLYVMLHLGLPLPARSAKISPAREIVTHFSDRQSASVGKGLLATECLAIRELNHYVEPNTLFLFDEAFSSTNSIEAGYIAQEILSAYAQLDAKGIFSTHMHQLTACVYTPEEPAYNAYKLKSKKPYDFKYKLDDASSGKVFCPVLLMCPVASQVYRTEGTNKVAVGNSDDIGECFFYTKTGFLDRLKKDSLDSE